MLVWSALYLFRESRQFECDIRLNAFSKSIDIRLAAACGSSKADRISFHVSTRNWLAPVPFTPPNWEWPSETFFLRRSRTKLSRHLEKSGVHERLRSWDRELGTGTLGISVTVSLAHISGHSSLNKHLFKDEM